MKHILYLLALLISCSAGAQSYDAAGNDTLYSRGFPNEYSQLKKGRMYPDTPYRREYYYATRGPRDYTAILHWNKAQYSGQVTGGKILTPNQRIMNADRVWKKGLTGAGIKIMVIDSGYSNDTAHLALTVSGSFNPSNSSDSIEHRSYTHTAQVVSLIAARNVDSAHILGTAYGASVYTGDWRNMDKAIYRAKVLGCHIIYFGYPLDSTTATAGVKAAMLAFQATGGLIVMPAGDGTSLAAMAYGCGLPGVINVGGLKGGGVTELSSPDSFYRRQVQARNSRHIDFALPDITIAASFDNTRTSGALTGSTPSGAGHNNLYASVRGTAYTGAEVVGALAIVWQWYGGTLSKGRTVYQKLRQNGRSFRADGVVAVVPNLAFLP